MSGRDRLSPRRRKKTWCARSSKIFPQRKIPKNWKRWTTFSTSMYSMVDDPVGEPKAAGDRSFEGLVADSTSLAATLVNAAIWAATLLYTAGRSHPALRPGRRSLEILAELTAQRAMIGELSERIAELQGAGGLRDVKNRIAPAISPPSPAAAREAGSRNPFFAGDRTRSFRTGESHAFIPRSRPHPPRGRQRRSRRSARVQT